MKVTQTIDDKPPEAELRWEINLHEIKVMQTGIIMTNHPKQISGGRSISMR